MAEGPSPAWEGLEKLTETLTCPVCNDFFEQPKILPCLHYYCIKSCIERMAARTGQGQPFPCPKTAVEGLNGPRGIATDQHGLTYVNEEGISRLQVFDKDWKVVRTLQGKSNHIPLGVKTYKANISGCIQQVTSIRRQLEMKAIGNIRTQSHQHRWLYPMV